MQAMNYNQSESALFLNSPILSTERLVLRPPHKEDAEDLAELANNINIARMLGTMPHPYSVKDAEIFIENTSHNSGRACVYAVTESESGRLIGIGGLHEDIKRYKLPFLGYWLGEAYWGKGYATETARSLVDLFFKVTHQPLLMASVRDDNPASRTVIKKCGGIYQSSSKVHNALLNEDHMLEHYHVTRESWMGEIAA